MESDGNFLYYGSDLLGSVEALKLEIPFVTMNVGHNFFPDCSPVEPETTCPVLDIPVDRETYDIIGEVREKIPQNISPKYLTSFANS